MAEPPPQDSALVHLASFQQQHERLYVDQVDAASSPDDDSLQFPALSSLVDARLENHDCDLDVQALRILTPFELVEEEIRRKRQLQERKKDTNTITNGSTNEGGAGDDDESDDGSTAETSLANTTNAVLDALAVSLGQGNPPLACLAGVVGPGASARNSNPAYYKPPTLKLDPLRPVDTLPNTELIIRVHISPSVRSKQSMQEILVLGSHKLTDLRDVIDCMSDHIFEGPHCKSGLFYIEGTFYNDRRDPNSIDYSAPILKHLTDSGRTFLHPEVGNVANFQVASMNSVTLRDLSVSPHARYLYLHQGDCEHVVTFESCHVVHANDEQNRQAYPIVLSQNKVRRRKCRICDVYPAKWVTFGDKLADENPCFFCDQCYRPLHYTATGQLRYDDFEVFPYYR